MPKPGSPEGASILHLAPFDFGSNGSLEVPLRFVGLGGRPHVLDSAANPPEGVSWAANAPVPSRIGNDALRRKAHPVDDPASPEDADFPGEAPQIGSGG